MAKEIEKLDEDFEELDFDFDDSEFGDFFNDPPPQSGREALTSTLKNAGSSFVQEFNVANIDNITKLLEKTIPARLQTNVNDLVGMKDSLFKEIADNGPSIKASANKLISLTEKFLPKDGMIGNAISRLKDATSEEESSRNNEASKEEVLNNKLLSMLESTISEKSTKEHYEEKLKESLDYKKNLNSLQIQNHMAANLERLSSFNIDVSSSFYRKTLELQFRQLDTSLEMLTINKVSSDMVKNQLEAIVKNTALPDAVKLRSAEVISMLAKNKMAESGINMMFGEGTRFDKMKKKIIDKFSGIVKGAEESLSEAAGMGEMLEMMREQSAAMGNQGGMFGSLAADWIQNILGEKISQKMAGTEIGDKILAGAQDAFSDPSEFFQDKLDASYASKDKDSFMEKFKRMFFSNMVDITKNDFSEQVVSMSKANPNESAIYTNRTDTAITKTIPTLLSEILQETASIYTVISKKSGITDRADKRIYDFDTDALITEKETKDKITQKLSNAVKKGGGNWNIKKATDTLIKDSKFTFKPEERATLEKAVMEHMMDGGTASTKMFKNPEFLKRLGDKKLVKRIIRLNEQFENRGSKIDIATNKSEINTYLDRAMSSIKNPKMIIEEFRDRGNLDQLTQMGLVDVDNETGNVSVNSKKYKKLVSDTFYNESLKEHKGLNVKEKPRTVNKETAELLNTVKDANLNFEDSKLGKGISRNLKKVRRYAKTKQPVKDILKTKDRIANEMTGENLEKNLDTIAKELTKDNLKKRATQAYDFAVDQTSEENIKLRKEQSKEFINTAKEKVNKAKEFVEKETTKESLIQREKDIRKWMDEKVTVENAKDVKNNILEEFNKSKIKGTIDKKLEESQVSKIIDDNIQKAINTGKTISKSKLVSNILKEVDVGIKEIEGSELFKKSTQKASDIKNDILNLKVNDKTVSEVIDDINLKKEEILNPILPKDEDKNTIPLSERKTLIESMIEIAESVKLAVKEKNSNIKEDNDLLEEELIIIPKDSTIDKEKNKGVLKDTANKLKKLFSVNNETATKPESEDVNKIAKNDSDSTERKDEIKEIPKDKTLIEKISELIESLSKNKEAIEENSDVVEKNKKDTADKFAFNDTNKDGIREGSFKERMKSMTRSTISRITGKVDQKEEKDKKSLWSYISALLPFGGILTTLISGITGLMSTVGTFGKGVFGLVSALSTVTKFLGNGIIGPIFKLVGGLIPGLLKMGIDVSTGALGAGWKGLKKFVNVTGATKGIEKKAFGSLAKNMGKRALMKVPGLGLATGAYLGYDYLKGGDTVGALGTWASTLMSQIPVIGTGAGIAMDAWLMKRDMDKEEEKTDESEEAVEEETTEKEEKRKEEEKKLQEEWTQNSDNIEKQLKNYENKYEDIEKEKEEIEKEEAVKSEKNTNSNTSDNSFSGTGEEMDPKKKQTLDDIDRQRAAIQAKLQAANPNSQFQTMNGRSRYNAYGGFGKSSATTGDRFAIADEPMSYKDLVGASKDDIKKMIVDNSKKTGMNPNIMLTMAAKESGMNPNAKAPTSSATGLYQFLNDTWRDVVKNYGSKYGLTPANANRLNPEHSTLMAGEYLKQNLAPIKKVKGNINATDAYLTHFLGPGGARKFLSANPNESAAIMGDAVVKANSSIFTDGGRVRTVGEVYQVIAKQLKKTAQQFGITGVIENKFQSGGEIADATSNIGSNGVNVEAKGEAGISGVADPFAINPSEQKTPATNKVLNNNTSNDVKPPVTNTYSSKGITNTPMDVSNAQQYTRQIDTSVNDTMMKNAVKQSIELSSTNSKQLDNIVANTKTIADNTSGANKLLSEIKDLLGKVNLNSTSTDTATGGSNVIDNNTSRPPEKETLDVVSMGRGGSLMSYLNKNGKSY